MTDLQKQDPTYLQTEDFRKSILAFEEKFKNMPGIETGAKLEAICPLKHTFVPGAYIREIFMPKGSMITSKIHKIKHPYFVMSGSCLVMTEKGIFIITAPYQGITEPSTKRLLYMYEDTVWITVHATNETDLEKIEEQIIAKTFDDPALKLEDKS